MMGRWPDLQIRLMSLLRSSPPAVPVVAVGLAVLLTHIAAVHRCPLYEYGSRGAEYIEHTSRIWALERTADQSLVVQLLAVPFNVAALDFEYPALLHVVAAMWGRVFGEGLAATIHLNLVFGAVLALATGLAAREIARRFGRVEERLLPWVAAMASSTVLLLPAVFATARRYYYDLPMTTWCVVALVALLYLPRSRGAVVVAGGASAAALLTKWTAVFFLIPLWLGGLAQLLSAERQPPRRETLRRWLLGGLLTILLCVPVMVQTSGFQEALGGISEAVGSDWRPQPRSMPSLDVVLFRGSEFVSLPTPPPSGQTMTGFVARFHVDGLVHSSFGPLLLLALAFCLAVGYRSWATTAVGLAFCAIPLAIHVFIVEVRDERLLLPMLPWAVIMAALAWGSCPFGSVRALTWGLVGVAGVVQMAAVDGKLRLPDPWSMHSPEEHRGWVMAGDEECSPHEEIEAMSQEMCAMFRRGGRLMIDQEVSAHNGFDLYMQWHCSLESSDGDEIPTFPPTGPAVVLTTEECFSPWPNPAAEVVARVPEPARVYLYKIF